MIGLDPIRPYLALLKWGAVAAVVLAIAGVIGWQRVRISTLSAQVTTLDSTLAMAAERAKATDREFRAREDRWKLDQKEARVAHEKATAQLRADSAAADAAAGRLQDRIRTLVADARRGAAHPATPGNGPAADAALDLLADMSSRLDQAAGELAVYAEAARLAGEHCARAYDALTHE